MRPRGRMRLYCCGGTGLNIGANYLQQSNEPLFAEISPVFIDTSRSNMKPEIDPSQIFIMDDLDGSGKVRSENYAQISNVIKKIVHTHKPLDFNVVIFSASGGSGSVFGPLVLAELLERNETVVCVVIGSDESTITANNTIKTLKSLEGISSKTGKPAVMYYRHNRRGKPRSEVDAEVLFAINALAVLASRQIEALDTMDIKKWIQFDSTTSVQPRLAALEVFDSTDGPWGDYNPISVISIYASPDEPTIPVVPEYHCDGYANLQMGDVRNIHYLIDVNVVPTYAAAINKTLREQNEALKARPALASIVDKNDNVDNNGMVI